MKRWMALALAVLLLGSLAACGGAAPQETQQTAVTVAPETTETTPVPTETTEAPTAAPSQPEAVPADGVYTVDVDTDSSMFHVNEALEGKGTLTVENGSMLLHVTLAGKGYSKLCLGSVEDAKKADATILDFSEDSVKYPDGFEDTAYGFDIPLEVLGVEFPIATFGKKSETWKNHTMTVSNPVLVVAG